MNSNGENQKQLMKNHVDELQQGHRTVNVIAFQSLREEMVGLGIYLVDITGGDVNPMRGIHGDSKYQPDWYHPVGWSVSPAANFVHYLG